MPSMFSRGDRVVLMSNGSADEIVSGCARILFARQTPEARALCAWLTNHVATSGPGMYGCDFAEAPFDDHSNLDTFVRAIVTLAHESVRVVAGNSAEPTLEWLLRVEPLNQARWLSDLTLVHALARAQGDALLRFDGAGGPRGWEPGAKAQLQIAVDALGLESQIYLRRPREDELALRRDHARLVACAPRYFGGEYRDRFTEELSALEEKIRSGA